MVITEGVFWIPACAGMRVGGEGCGACGAGPGTYNQKQHRLSTSTPMTMADLVDKGAHMA